MDKEYKVVGIGCGGISHMHARLVCQRTENYYHSDITAIEENREHRSSGHCG